ncbi:hypothetical protein FMM05_02725 [Flavobacterium zepuense]|uniref:Uncharacterized protein n=1 Tax=Flavobacterium zepuense TaxID=2593302 RepID=A0A552VAR3_9FLAO|nr:M56 family metallopeptidase [Flavobacterium zepuense]TRW27571.1 hypothetical protein FMM05_02725 [Flavobacterium zepuense]
MENLIIYMVKAAGLTAVFYTAYYLLLRKETFFTANRRFLAAGLLTAVLLPLIVFTKIVWIDPAPAMPLQQIDVSQLMLLQTPPNLHEKPIEINWFYVAFAAYGAGILFFSIRFMADLYKVRQMLKGKMIVKEGGFKFIDAPDVQSPFSFFNYIVYNSALLQPQELESIISHEKVHSSQKHSLDMLLAQLFCVVFWFNPVAWMYKKAISQNLEFIADARAVKIIQDKIAYQKTLLKITVQPECIAITNHFYQSLIKKRIIMLNKQQSKKRNSWKYAVVLPALAAFMLVFQEQVIARERLAAPQNTSTGIIATTPKSTKISVDITANSTDEELEANANVLRRAFEATVDIAGIKRNANNLIIAIKVEVSHKGESKNYQVSSPEPITDFSIQMESKGNGPAQISFIAFKKQQATATLVAKGTTDTIHIAADNLVYKTDIANNVLFIVDGFRNKNGLNDVNPNDIESIEVRKDTDELVKLYGKEAANGVVFVTTKKRTGAIPSIKTGYMVEYMKAGFRGKSLAESENVPSHGIGSINGIGYMGTPAQVGPRTSKFLVRTETRRADNDSLISTSTYTQNDDPRIQKIDIVKLENKKSSGNTIFKSISDMNADELDAAQREYQENINEIDKAIKLNKDSKVKGAVSSLEQMKESATKTLQEIKKAKKQLKKRP